MLKRLEFQIRNLSNVLSYRTIKLIKETNTLDYVASGLTAGDKIIVHNALLVYNSLK